MLIKMNYKEILIRGSLSRGVNRNSNTEEYLIRKESKALED